MIKFKSWLKDTFYFICFLFRPIITIGVSFAFMVISLGILIFVIQYIPEGTRTYEILLAILTGLTASFFVSITIELCNNYRFNCKRHRELRKYFGFVSMYKLEQKVSLEVMEKNEIDTKLGYGYTYDTFCKLKDIIPVARESLGKADYLYQKEINEIDDILYNYDNLIKIIWVKLLSIFSGLINSTNEKSDYMNEEESEQLERYCPELFEFLRKEANYYKSNNTRVNSNFHKESHQHLENIIENAIFNEYWIFSGFFEVVDKRYMENENLNADGITTSEQTSFNFLSDMISHNCGEIDKSMTKLQKRVGKEPHFWILAKEGSNE